MKTVRAVFKNGVFVPVENVNLEDGVEAVVVYVDGKRVFEGEPSWWNELAIDDKKKRALKLFSENLSAVPLNDVKVSVDGGDFEVFVLVQDESEAVRPVMEAGMKVYEETGVYVPIQVISERRLNRWKEQGSEIYEAIRKGVSIK